MAGGFWSNLGNKALTNFTGRTETALLEVENVTKEMSGVPEMSNAGTTLDTLKKLKTAAASMNKTVSETLSMSQALTKSVAKKMVIPVQFNPSELTVNAFNPSFVVRQDMTGSNNTQGQNNTNPTNTLTVQLYYDDMRITDSFMVEKLDLNAVGLVKQAVAEVGDAITSRQAHTVQPQVEGLMALLNNRGTRTLTFRWNDFEFRGILELVQAQYTMFNTVGAPVRAKVLLQISQALTNQERKHWRADLVKAFHDNRLDASRAQDKVGALFNLNL